MIKFKVPHRLPGLNEVTAKNRTNKHVGAKLKKETEELISFYVPKGVKLVTKANVTLTWHERTKRRDPDNVASAVKFLFDSMVNCDLLASDSQVWVGSIHHNFIYGSTWDGVVVELEEEDYL